MRWQNYYDQSSMKMSRQSDTYQSRSTISLQAIIRSTKYNRHNPLCLFFCLSRVPRGSTGIRISLTPAHGLNCKISHFLDRTTIANGTWILDTSSAINPIEDFCPVFLCLSLQIHSGLCMLILYFYIFLFTIAYTS